jgi:hypothetical protein
MRARPRLRMLVIITSSEEVSASSSILLGVDAREMVGSAACRDPKLLLPGVRYARAPLLNCRLADTSTAGLESRSVTL